MTWESPYFTKEEMRCQHTGFDGMDAQFMELLTELRGAYGKPMRVTSAYRHPTHPIEAKKTKKYGTGKAGSHSTGRAVDIAVERGEAWELLNLALAMGFTGIGVNQKGDGRFIHLDNIKPDEFDRFLRPTVWSY